MKVCTINLKAPRNEDSLEEKDYEVEAYSILEVCTEYLL